MLWPLFCMILLSAMGYSVFQSYRADVKLRAARGLLIEHLVLMRLAQDPETASDEFKADFEKFAGDHTDRTTAFLVATK